MEKRRSGFDAREDYAVAVCHDDLPVLSTPGGLHRLELDLGHHHAQRAVRPVDASGYIEAGLAADGALAEELGRALAHGVSEVRPKGVVSADEARGASIVAGGERRPAPICHIDGGGAGLSGQGFQSRIDHGARVVVRSLQQGAQRLLRGENNRSGAVTLQLAVQQGEVQRQGRPGSLTQLGLGVGSRDALAKPHDKRDKGDRCGDQHQAAGSSHGAQHVRIFAQFLHGCHQLRTHSLGPGWINVVSKEKATARRRMRSRFSARAPGVTMAAEPRPKSADGRST